MKNKSFNNSIFIEFVKNQYYSLDADKTISLYNGDLEKINCIILEKQYDMFTYIDDKDLFYFYNHNEKNKLYILDSKFKFVKKVEMEIPKCLITKIKYISYCKKRKAIIITTSDCVLLFHLDGKFIKCVYKVEENIDKLNDCMAPLGCEEDKIIIQASVCCGKDILIVFVKNNVTYISYLVKGKLSQPVYTTKEIIKAIFIINGYIWIVVKNCNKIELIGTGIECDSCFNDCKDYSIIESIALMEASLSKILCSESQKIKAVIEKSDNIEDILCVNEYVSKLIYHTTILEYVLTEKLSIACKCEGEDSFEDCTCKKTCNKKC